MGYQLVEHIEVGAGGAASIEFTGIPQDGVDLQLVTSLRNTIVDTFMIHYIRINSATTSYSAILLSGDGSAASSGSTDPAFNVNCSQTTSGTFTNTATYLSNYSGSTSKSISIDSAFENNATFSFLQMVAGRRSQTDAVTALSIVPGAGTIAQYSTASLYKITAD